jgi:hypothetical protein
MRERAVDVLSGWAQATARNAVIVGAIATELGRQLNQGEQLGIAVAAGTPPGTLPGMPGAKA